jgi:hypothetical protein
LGASDRGWGSAVVITKAVGIVEVSLFRRQLDQPYCPPE